LRGRPLADTELLYLVEPLLLGRKRRLPSGLTIQERAAEDIAREREFYSSQIAHLADEWMRRLPGPARPPRPGQVRDLKEAHRVLGEIAHWRHEQVRVKESPAWESGADRMEPEQVPGPFEITLDLRECKASRDGTSADFGGKEYPWRIFRFLCHRHPQSSQPIEILDAIWGKGVSSADNLYFHINVVRSILKPLGLTLSSTRRVGYKLAETPQR
jgi:hypothetical protein